MVAQVFATEIDPSLIAVVCGLFFTIGVGLFSWTLITVVKLTMMVGVLEEKVRQLAEDIDHIIAGNPEIRVKRR